MPSIESQLADLRARSLFRKLRDVRPEPGQLICCDGKTLVNFSSNDYLGLADEPWLREAAKHAIDEFGVGAGASRLVCGNLAPHARLERSLAEFKRTEAALAFGSGYATALGTIQALLGRGDIVVLDKLCHACLIDGARASGATIRVFPHNNVATLGSHLKWARTTQPQDARVLVCTESVFSMDGDLAPLAEIVGLKNRFGAMLMLDEAHAVGVLGKNGRGLAEELGLADQVEVQMGTLGKALGVGGGYVAGSRHLIELLINRARPFIYSTAPPPALAAASGAAVDFMMTEAGEARRQLLVQNLGQFLDEAPRAILPGGGWRSAIIPIVIGAEDAALAASQWLQEEGFLIPAIRYPTVARGSARLRVTISAAHEPAQISRLCAALGKLAERMAGAKILGRGSV